MHILPKIWNWSVWHFSVANKEKVDSSCFSWMSSSISFSFFINFLNDFYIKLMLLVGMHVSHFFVQKHYWSNRLLSEDFGIMGLRYGSGNLSMGAILMPFACL